MLIDAPAEGASLPQIKKRVIDFTPQMAVFDTSTPSIYSDVNVLEEVASWFNGNVLTVLVGTHPSALSEETIRLSNSIDVIARHEYDYTLLDIANSIQNGNLVLSQVLGITYKDGCTIKSTEERPYIENLDAIPWVSKVYKKHVNINNYFYAHTKPPVISFFAGRGCPNKCFYCVYPQVMFGHTYRHRSAEDVVGEIEYIVKEFPEVREVLIDDDNFTVDQDHVMRICDIIINRGLRLSWTVEARVNLRYEVMVAMRRAGCRLLVAGFESGDQQILDNMCKGATVTQAEQFCQNAKKAGLRVHGCFMVGNRGETRDSMERTLQLALKLKPDTAQFFPLMVYPGTRAYMWAKDNSYIHAKSYRDWLDEDGLHNCVLNTDKLTAKELVNFCDEARRKFYLRPEYLITKAIDLVKNPSEIKRTVKAGSILIKHLLKGKEE